jgi:hypothetical protein
VRALEFGHERELGDQEEAGPALRGGGRQGGRPRPRRTRGPQLQVPASSSGRRSRLVAIRAGRCFFPRTVDQGRSVIVEALLRCSLGLPPLVSFFFHSISYEDIKCRAHGP